MRDERSQTEQAKIPYDKTKVQAVAAIYTYTNAAGTNDAVKEEPGYNATVQGTVTPEVSYTDVNDNRVFTTSYDAVEGQWKATLKVDVDAVNQAVGVHAQYGAGAIASSESTVVEIDAKATNGYFIMLVIQRR